MLQGTLDSTYLYFLSLLKIESVIFHLTGVLLRSSEREASLKTPISLQELL